MPSIRRYLYAAGILVSGVFVRWLLDPFLGYGHAFLGPTMAGAIVAGTLGMGPACFAIGVGFVVSRYLFVAPRYALTSDVSTFAASATVSLVVSLSLAWMAALLRHAIHRARSQSVELRREVDRRAQTESVLRRLIDVQEQEKQTLGHDLHDGVLQQIIGARMLLEGLGDSLAGQEQRTVVEAAMASLSRGLDDGRQMVRGMRPTVLDDFGLEAAIRDLQEQYRAHGIDVGIDIGLGGIAVGPTTSTAIYRIVQESLSNVRKHSGSALARVRVTAEETAGILVAVEDDGRGFEPEVEVAAGFGLIGIRERTKLAGGTCEIVSTPGKGTRVIVRLPAMPAGVAPVPGTMA